MTKHDQLQSQCFIWFHNNHSDVRGLMWANDNSPRNKRDGAKRKAIGMIAGVFDLLFYHHGCLYAFDIKVGFDKLSKKQLTWKKLIEMHGGKCYEIRSLSQFQMLINGVLNKEKQ